MQPVAPAFALLLSAASAQAPWTVAQMTADLRQIAAAVRTDWSYHQDHRRHFDVDVDRMLTAAEAALPAVANADDFARVLRQFTAGLQDGHAWSQVPGESPPAGRKLPFRVSDCAEGLVVTAVAAGVEPPRRGDLLLALDGVPVAELLRANAATIAASTPGMRRQLAIRQLQSTQLDAVRCSFADAAGDRREVELASLPPGTTGPSPAPAAANWSLRWPRAEVALLRIDSFTVPRWREWLRAKPEEREPFLQEGRARIDAIIAELRRRPATALVIDLRGNGGGTDLLGIHLAERLLDDSFEYFLLSAQHDGRWSPPMGTTYGKGDHVRFAGRIVALVDEQCFSTTDNFVRCLDDLHPEFTVVGRPTGGGTGAPRQLVVAEHSKAVLGACTQRVYGPRGKLIEGRGTVPDVPVQWTRADWQEGRDPDLAAALAAIDRRQ